MECTWIILWICSKTVLREKRQIGIELKFEMSLGVMNLTKMQLVVTVEFAQASECVIGLVPLKGQSGCTEDGTYPCKKLLKNQIKQ